jgi:hypothetical protein
MKNRIDRNPSQRSTWYSETSKRTMVIGPMKRNNPKRRSDPPPMTMAKVITEYATNRFTGNPPFKTFAA